MKKKMRILSLTLILALVFSLAVHAATPRYAYTATCIPKLSFSGTTATCAAAIRANATNSKITASMTLVRVHDKTGAETEVAYWSGLSGTGTLTATRTQSGCASGATYRLYLDATVSASAGTEYPSAYTSARCP